MYSIRDEMGDFWKLLSVNSDLEGMEFISTLEAKVENSRKEQS